MRVIILKITDIRVVSNRKPVILPVAWRAAWSMPDAKPNSTAGFSFVEIHTDEGITGIDSGGLSQAFFERLRSALIGMDPFYVERFWRDYINQKGREYIWGERLGGVDSALWDIVGKATGKPVYKLFGAYRDRVQVYAATTQLHSAEEHVKEAVEFREKGIRAIKLRLHRQDYRDDLGVVEAVRDAVGNDMDVLVDGNQNNALGSPNYKHWSRRIARKMAKKLDALDVYYFEDPLPLRDIEGLKQLAEAVDMYISGGEHAQDVNHFTSLLFSRAFDIVEPDIIMDARIGMTGMRKVAQIAESVERMIVPHMSMGPNQALHLAATLQVVASMPESVCPYVEYDLEPPALTVETQQMLLKEPIVIDSDGCVQVPQLPGIGVEIDEETVNNYL